MKLLFVQCLLFAVLLGTSSVVAMDTITTLLNGKYTENAY